MSHQHITLTTLPYVQMVDRLCRYSLYVDIPAHDSSYCSTSLRNKRFYVVSDFSCGQNQTYRFAVFIQTLYPRSFAVVSRSFAQALYPVNVLMKLSTTDLVRSGVSGCTDGIP